jgi:alpha-beta hydrolase superfamily lysophospholipase
MTEPVPLVCFSHGQESGPWGSKIRALAEVAGEQGFQVLSVDYAGEPDPAARVDRLLRECPRDARPLVLVGSSMGGYVAAAASAVLRPAALFLMAPAFYVEGFPQQVPLPVAPTTVIVHGWSDDVVPVENSIRFARAFKATLLLVDGGHRLAESLPWIREQFRLLLRELRPAPS